MNSNYATMRFEPEALHGANAGLNVARELMEKIKQEFPWITYGDLWTLGGVAAIQVCPFSYLLLCYFPYFFFFI
jgi:catalase (peroxidase I)